MQFVFPSPATIVKSHEKKRRNYFCVTTITTTVMVKCRCIKQEEKVDFNYCEEYLKGLYQTKFYYDSVKEKTLSYSSALQIDKKINNVKEDPRKQS